MIKINFTKHRIIIMIYILHKIPYAQCNFNLQYNNNNEEYNKKKSSTFFLLLIIFCFEKMCRPSHYIIFQILSRSRNILLIAFTMYCVTYLKNILCDCYRIFKQKFRINNQLCRFMQIQQLKRWESGYHSAVWQITIGSL